jgi:hypothetical protein
VNAKLLALRWVMGDEWNMLDTCRNPSMKTTNLLAIQRVLETRGVIFVDPGEHRDGGVGVRLRVKR